jgi:EndoU nuclease-like protein
LFPELCIPGNQGARAKPVNLPATSKVTIDMDHVASGHMSGGARVSAGKTLFPGGMSKEQVENAIRQAYRSCKRIETQGSRVLVRGQGSGLKIEMWINTQTNVIETAYPIK